MNVPNRTAHLHPLLEPLEPRLMLDAGLNLGNWFTSPPVIVGTAPAANTHMATASTHVSVIYDQDVDPASASDQAFVVHAMQTGRLLDPPSTISVNGDTVTLAPAQSFHPGEFVQATATTGIQNLVGHAPAHPLVWQFRTQVTRGTGLFSDSGQRLGRSQSVGVGLGDLDGDGDLDAFVTNGAQPDKVWLNDGQGSFTDSGQSLGTSTSNAVALGDLDGDGDLDAFVTNGAQPDKVWLNDGQGSFSDSGQSLGTSTSNAVALGDLDGDGDLDAFVTNGAQPDMVWVNDGGGSFTDSGQSLGTSASNAVALGDLDGDGDLDAFVTNGAQPDMVWVNDGGGSFSDSGQRLGSSQSVGVGLGDLDGDGDLDAFVTNGAQPDMVWVNDGQGRFTDSGQSLGTSTSNAVALGDVDGDGDLDAFVASRGQPDTGGQPDTVWVNDGHGSFSDSGQVLGTSASNAVALGDLDGDGDLDAFVANSWGEPDLVWVNQEAGEIHGSTWADLDGDGLWDDGEPGLEGWTIYLDRNRNGEHDAGEPSTVTDAEGHYSFTGLSSGTYTVAQVLQQGWVQIHPARDGNNRLFVLQEGEPTGATIHEIEPSDGSTLNSFPTPEFVDGAGPQGLAVGPSSVFFINGRGGTAHTLWELDLDTGTVIDSDIVDAAFPEEIAGLGYLNGNVYIEQYESDHILVWDPVRDVVLDRLTVSADLKGGLTGAADRGLLFGSNHGGDVFAIDPATGNVLDSFNIGVDRLENLAYHEGELLAAAGRDLPIDVSFEFYVYLQTGSDSGIRGPFSHSIPLDGHPWVQRIDYGTYTKYRVDDCGTGVTNHDDLEVNIYYDENGQPIRAEVIRASGANSSSVRKRFIFDFVINGEVVIEDWAGELIGGRSKYGETIELQVEDDWVEGPSSPPTVYRIDPLSGNVLGSFTLEGTGDLGALGGDGMSGAHTIPLRVGEVVKNIDFGNPPTWVGEIDDHWHNGANWSGGVPPEATHMAVFRESATYQPALYQNEAIAALDFRTAGWTLSCNGHTLTVGEGGIAGAGAPTSTIDLGTGNLVVDYTGASPHGEIADMICSGLNLRGGGNWDGPGITSSAAAADQRGVTAVGVIDNGDTETGIGGLATFGGVAVDETCVLAACTWWGDINLDGVVDSNDYDRIDTNYVLWIKEGRVPDGGWRWAVGDLDYDNVIDSNDYDLIDNAFLLQDEPAAAGGAASVAGPDPLPLGASSPKASDLTEWPEVALVAGPAERQPVPQLADVLPALATVSAASEAAPFDGFATALAAESANSAILTAWPPPALRPVAEADRAAAADLLDPLALPALDIRL